MLLLTLNRLALRLTPLRKVFALLAGTGAAVMMWLLTVGEQTTSGWLRLSLIATLWSLLLFAFTNLFRTLPPLPLPQMSWRDRLVTRGQLVLFYGMTFAFLVLVLGVGGMSVKLGLMKG